jgi:hypothetical protein
MERLKITTMRTILINRNSIDLISISGNIFDTRDNTCSFGVNIQVRERNIVCDTFKTKEEAEEDMKRIIRHIYDPQCAKYVNPENKNMIMITLND